MGFKSKSGDTLKALGGRIGALEGKTRVSISEVFNPAFVAARTDAATIDEFLANSGMMPEEAEAVSRC